MSAQDTRSKTPLVDTTRDGLAGNAQAASTYQASSSRLPLPASLTPPWLPLTRAAVPLPSIRNGHDGRGVRETRSPPHFWGCLVLRQPNLAACVRTSVLRLYAVHDNTVYGTSTTEPSGSSFQTRVQASPRAASRIGRDLISAGIGPTVEGVVETEPALAQ